MSDTNDRTLKFQPGALVNMTIFGRVVGGSVVMGEDGQIHKYARVQFGNARKPQYISVAEDQLRLTTVPRVTSATVTKPGEEPVKVPFAPVRKVDGGKQWDFGNGEPEVDEASIGNLVLPEKTEPVACQNCEWAGELWQVKGILDISERVAPGEAMPVGECPECGALAHFAESDDGEPEVGEAV